MKRIVLALAVMVGAAFASAPSWATTVPLGALPGLINPIANEQKGAASSATIDYTFSLAAQSQFSVGAFGPIAGISNGKTTGLSALTLQLLNSTNVIIDSVVGGLGGGTFGASLTDLLNSGSYTLRVLVSKAASKNLYDVTTTVTVALSQTPVPAAGLLLLTAIGGLGGLGFWRKRGASPA
jgi:hypothetical protein